MKIYSKPRISFIDRKMSYNTPGAIAHHHENGLPSGSVGGVGRRKISSSNFNKLTISDLFNLNGKRVLVRVDFNVLNPKTGEIKSDARLKASVQTIKELMEKGAKIILLSHNDNPHKAAKDLNLLIKIVIRNLSHEKVAARLTELLIKEKIFLPNNFVRFCPEVVGEKAFRAVRFMLAGDILLLENCRSDKRDVNEDMSLALEIIDTVNPDFVVLEGFSALHRDQPSVTGIARIAKEQGKPVAMGRLVEKEIDIFGRKILENPQRPFTLFSGGSKVSGKGGKIEILINLIDKVDHVVIGGAMLYAFLQAKGFKDIGNDPLGGRTTEEDIDAAKKLLKAHPDKIILPTVLSFYNKSGRVEEIDITKKKVPKGFVLGDVSHEAIIAVSKIIGNKGTVLWNGDFGYTNHETLGERFHEGSYSILDLMWEVKSNGGVSVVGGGDSGKVVEAYEKKVEPTEPILTLLSTGGGASTTLVSKGTLPGLELIDNRH